MKNRVIGLLGMKWGGLLVALALVFAAPEGAIGQSRLDPAIRVNDKFITRHDLEQRALLLRALGAPGDLDREARDRLIDEQLQLQAAEELGLEATEDGIDQGIAEFATRANATPEEFMETLNRNGVATETFRQFVEAGILWREVVRRQFAPRAQVTEEDVDRAAALAGREGGARVLLSEIFLPARNPAEAEASEERARQLSQINGIEAFSAAARNISVSPTRNAGGRIDWIPLSELPSVLQAQVLTLPPGGVTDPVRVPNAVAVFQVRALQELPVAEPQTLAVEYAEFRIPGGTPQDARKIAGRIDTCDDLYGEAFGLPEDRLFREVRPLAEIPADVRAQIDRLDANETSTAIRRGSTQVLLMLCGRTTSEAEEVNRGELRRQLVNQRVQSYANGYLAQLRADAVIVDLR